MVGNPYRWRAANNHMENRNATAGCMLSMLFTVPYIVQSGLVSSLTAAAAVVLYVALVVPLLTGILSTKTLIYYIRLTISTSTSWDFWQDMSLLAMFIVDWSHFLYLQATGVHATIMQITFNLAAEKVFCPDQRLCCLYVLLFYSVIAYLHKSLQTRPWANLFAQQNTTAELVKLTTVFMIVRLGKAVVMTMVLLTITVQFRHMEPPPDYVALTLLFFCLTQYRGDSTIYNSVTRWLAKLNLDFLEGMEELIVPFVLDVFIVLLNTIVAAASLLTANSYFIILILSYTNILVPFTLLKENTWEPLSKEWRKIKRFRFALWDHPKVREGGECPICLDTLRALTSRITPCDHVFHSSCLRKCLHYTPWCPLCKTPL